MSHLATAIWLHDGVGGPEEGRVAHNRPPYWSSSLFWAVSSRCLVPPVYRSSWFPSQANIEVSRSGKEVAPSIKAQCRRFLLHVLACHLTVGLFRPSSCTSSPLLLRQRKCPVFRHTYNHHLQSLFYYHCTTCSIFATSSALDCRLAPCLTAQRDPHGRQTPLFRPAAAATLNHHPRSSAALQQKDLRIHQPRSDLQTVDNERLHANTCRVALMQLLEYVYAIVSLYYFRACDCGRTYFLLARRIHRKPSAQNNK